MRESKNLEIDAEDCAERWWRGLERGWLATEEEEEDDEEECCCKAE